MSDRDKIDEMADRLADFLRSLSLRTCSMRDELDAMRARLDATDERIARLERLTHTVPIGELIHHPQSDGRP